jgi:hypothetical protein
MATDRNHAKAEEIALRRLLHTTYPASSFRDAVESVDWAEVGRLVCKQVSERLRSMPQFEVEFSKALVDLDEADREEAEADELFERQSAARRGQPYTPPTAA